MDGLLPFTEPVHDASGLTYPILVRRVFPEVEAMTSRQLAFFLNDTGMTIPYVKYSWRLEKGIDDIVAGLIFNEFRKPYICISEFLYIKLVVSFRFPTHALRRATRHCWRPLGYMTKPVWTALNTPPSPVVARPPSPPLSPSAPTGPPTTNLKLNPPDNSVHTRAASDLWTSSSDEYDEQCISHRRPPSIDSAPPPPGKKVRSPEYKRRKNFKIQVRRENAQLQQDRIEATADTDRMRHEIEAEEKLRSLWKARGWVEYDWREETRSRNFKTHQAYLTFMTRFRTIKATTRTIEEVKLEIKKKQPNYHEVESKLDHILALVEKLRVNNAIMEAVEVASPTKKNP